jgi:hypothetical protein
MVINEEAEYANYLLRSINDMVCNKYGIHMDITYITPRGPTVLTHFAQVSLMSDGRIVAKPVKIP